MTKLPILNAEDLTLRPFKKKDIPDIVRLAGDKKIYETTLNIPHPYSDKDAKSWLKFQKENLEAGKLVTYAVTLAETGGLVGSVSLTVNKRQNQAELGYWIGRPYWGGGYATRAARRLIQFGFEEMGLNRIHAHYMVKNPASGKVMKKVGMSYEGRLRQAVLKDGEYEDIEVYAILKVDYEDSLVK